MACSGVCAMLYYKLKPVIELMNLASVRSGQLYRKARRVDGVGGRRPNQWASQKHMLVANSPGNCPP